THIPGQPNPPQFASHQDEPDLLKQEIVKPIVHEVTEAIQPVRKITQEVRPVQETINQVITRGQQVQPAQTEVAQPAPTLALAVAAPTNVAVQAAPALEVIEEPVISTVAVDAPIALEAVEAVGADAARVGNLRTIPVNAAIIRFK